MIKQLFLLIFLSLYSYAITPYSLENLKEVNIKILNKKNTISKQLEKEIKNKIEEEFKNIEIKTESNKYSNFLIKIKIDKFEKTTFVRTSIMIMEEINPLRDKSLETVAITYKKDDEFESDNLEIDIYESIIDYLLVDFIEQYKEEN